MSSASYMGIVESAYYADFSTMQIPAGSIITAHWSDCCRNVTVTTIDPNISSSIYASVTFTVGGLVSGPLNSSPQFLYDPVIYAMPGQSSTFSQAAWDPDGDSLVYSLTASLQSATQPVYYLPGYSATTPLGPAWNCTIDAHTGMLSFSPNSGGSLKGLIAIKVAEYRNGQLIGSVCRDHEITIIGVAYPNTLPQISTIQHPLNAVASGDTLITAPGQTVAFDLVLTDPDTGDFLQALSTPLSLYGGAVTIAQTGAATNPMTVHVTATAPASGSQSYTLPFSDTHCMLTGTAFLVLTVIADPTLLLASGTPTPTACDSANGAIDLTVIAGATPVSFLWSNGATTEDLSGLASGIYTVQVTDAGGQVLADTFTVNGNDLAVAFTEGWLHCQPDSGILTAGVSGGHPPYQYAWTTGDTAATLTGLAPAGYHVYVTDSAGCVRSLSHVLEVPDTCVVRFSGRVFFDMDGDCQHHPAEAGIPFQYVTAGTNGGFTDLTGSYQLLADTGTNTLTIQSPYPASPCASDSLVRYMASAGADSSGNDFARLPSANAPHDLAASLYSPPARPGMQRTVWLSAKNLSFDSTRCKLTYRFDPVFTLAGTYPPFTSFDPQTHTLSWDSIGPLMKNQVFQAVCTLHTPASTPLGTAFSDTLRAEATPADTSWWNNLAIEQAWVTGSYDPNVKEVSPKGETAAGFIPHTSDVLTYTIHFQNTGTDTAFFVTLRDTLDTDLALADYQAIASSHPYTLRVENEHILIFRFDLINLPDSNRDEPGSHGFVSFSLPLKNPAQGTVAENRAAIYFDFNPPVITNTVRNTVCDPVRANFSATRAKDGKWTLTSTSEYASAWTWDIAGISSNQAVPEPVRFADTGYYAVRLIVSNACSSDTVHQTLHESWTAGLVPGMAPAISIQPNPVAGTARIRISGAHAQRLTIRTPEGRVVCTLPVVNGEAIFVRGNLPAGVYYVQVHTESGLPTSQMMVLE